jgi:methylenetetrahydrofolate dehydrogenase (NADP+)/methenyltetrahydrofolate cyclohydrolase
MNIDGKKIRDKVLGELKSEEKSKDLRLVGVLVGDHPGSKKFMELKEKAAKEIGVDFKLYEFPEDISTNKLRDELNNIAKQGVNHGIIIELPLPEQINTQYILNTIPQEKDVDVLSAKAQGAFFVGKSKILPPAVEATKIVFDEHDVDIKGKDIAIFGYGLLVGKPIANWLAAQGASVFVINEFTKNPEEISKEADIIISGVGKTRVVKEDMVKDGAVVIDFGYSEGGKGDVDFDSVSKKASLITPVPGGIGPVVVAAVLKNLVSINQ